jgi:hypothetical protein
MLVGPFKQTWIGGGIKPKSLIGDVSVGQIFQFVKSTGVMFRSFYGLVLLARGLSIRILLSG